jgi:hypothetical protein
MQEANLFLVFLDRLNKGKLSYMVTGSVASIIYGEPRMTHDIDLVLELHVGYVQDFINLFPSDEFYCPPQEVIKTEIARETRGHFNIIHHETGFKADIYPIGQDELHKWAMLKRQKVKIGQSDILIAPPEYVIIRKLQYYKEGGSAKHLRDINRMFELSGESIDKPTLSQMITKYNLLSEWESSQAIP